MKLKEDWWIAFIFLIVIFNSCSAVNVTVGDNGQVPEGSAAVLTCDYERTPPSSTDIPAFRWEEMINGSPQVISLYQNGVGSVQSPYIDSGRYTVEGDSILTITNIMQSDNGRRFQCEVTILDDTPSIAQDSLTLSVAYINTPIAMSNSPVIEGESATFVCSVDANPVPVIILYRDETEIMRETTTNLTHTIDNVEISDAGNYICEASNMAGNRTSQIEQLDVHHMNTPIAISNNPVIEGESATIVCSVEANPVPVIILYRDETEIMRETTTNLTYTIDSVAISDAGNYKCEANNTVGIGTSQIEQLDVHYFDVGTLLFAISNSNVTESESVMFVCSVNANPDPVIILYKDGTEIKRGTTANLTYTIDNVTRSDAGNYKCEANNTAGNGTSQIEQLDVYYVKADSLSGVIIALIAVGCSLVVVGICLIYFFCAGKYCFSQNKLQTLDHNPPDDVEMDKAEGKSDLERYQASGGELYTQVNLQQKKKKPDSDNGSNKPAPVDV